MKVKLLNVRISFPALFTPEAFNEASKPAYKAAFLIPKNSGQIKGVMDAAVQALNEKFPGKGAAIFKQITGNANKCCIRDGDSVEYDGYADHWVVSARSAVRPLVINADKSPVTEADGVVYAGCYVNAMIDFYGYDNTGKGLSAQLQGVQFYADGDAFASGRAASVEEFDDLSADTDADSLLM